jgi:acetyltransferase-like isoleucine patch superfamily enzyme
MLSSLLRRLAGDTRKSAQKAGVLAIGSGTVLGRNVHFDFRAGVKRFKGRIAIGSDTMVDCRFVLERETGCIEVGDRTFINTATKLICVESIVIGSDVTIAWGCTLYDHNSHSLDWKVRASDHARLMENAQAGRGLVADKDWEGVKARRITIEDKAWLGFGVTVLNGVTIGEGAIVSAMSVVRTDVEPWTVVAGNPAVKVKALTRS